jgi:hypothetical protein
MPGAAAVSVCFDRVKPLVDQTINGLAACAFRDDPIAGPKYARATSIVSSAYKRHGKIIERAIIERLRDNNRLSVWNEDRFNVSAAAEALFSSSSLTSCLLSQLPYGEARRTVQIDMIVYDMAAQSLRAYEVKRGNGAFDAGKIRSIMRDLLCTHVLLKSYGEARGHVVAVAEAKIIFYYGMLSIQRPLSLAGNDLDAHFGFPVQEAVEEINAYFRRRLHELLEAG